MIPTHQKHLWLTANEIKQRREAMLYVSDRLGRVEWARDLVAKQLLERELFKVLDEIMQGHHLPFEWRRNEPLHLRNYRASY
jgi:hypothetical protein